MPHVLRFGIAGEASAGERQLLALADDYRQARHQSHAEEHRRLIDWRNDRFGELFDALVEWEQAKARVSQIERRIKRYHSEVRDRNAVTAEDAEALEAARAQRQATGQTAKAHRESWYRLQRAYRAAFAAAAEWKDVKTLDKRRELYGRLDWHRLLEEAERRARRAIRDADSPKKRRAARRRYDAVNWQAEAQDLAELAAIILPRDLERRRLSREYQGRGLHSATRGEIDAATKPKLSRTGPGTRYVYHSRRLPRPWRKLVVQPAGGLLVGDALAGRSKQLSLQRLPDVDREGRRRRRRYAVCQQLGNAEHPKMLRYVVRAHRPLLETDVIQRWALVIEHEPDRSDDGYWRRSAHITLKRDLEPKTNGAVDVLWVRVGWRRVKGGGIQVAEFRSPRVNEDLVLPAWLVERRLIVDRVEQMCDERANALLLERGVNVSGKRTGRPSREENSGMAALNNFLRRGRCEPALAEAYQAETRRLRRAKRIRRWAIGAIEKIYETAAARLAARHGSVWIVPLNLDRLKRYDQRDLLSEDRLPPASRRLLMAASPGKLQAALLRALPAASGGVAPLGPGVARSSDVLTSWVDSLGSSGGRVSTCASDRSQTLSEVLHLEEDG